MDLFGINGKKLTHTQIMENQLIINSVPTKADTAKSAVRPNQSNGVFLSHKDAEEYRSPFVFT